MNPLELGLSDEESMIVEKLLETFGSTSASWGGNRARFSFWISEFKESEDVDTRFCCPNLFPNARPGSQEFRLNDHEKIANFLLFSSSSYIPYPSGAGFDLT